METVRDKGFQPIRDKGITIIATYCKRVREAKFKATLNATSK